jgi:SsrA-binding protein
MPRSLSNPTVAAQSKPTAKPKDRDPVASGMRDAAFNRAASHNYFLSDKFEAGVALRGTEVKSIR